MEKRTFWDKFDAFMMKDNTFILLVMGAAAAIFAGTYMFINLGTGAFNDLSIVAMLKDGMDGGDYAAAAGFAAGFLIARVLEGPLVGLMDIGGTLQTGVGIGIPALFLSMGWQFPFSSFPVALLVGAVIGLVMGGVIMLIRKAVPEGVAVGGTSMMCTPASAPSWAAPSSTSGARSWPAVPSWAPCCLAASSCKLRKRGVFVERL